MESVERRHRSTAQCDERHVHDHVCSPLCAWLPYLRRKLSIEFRRAAHESKPLRPTLFNALVLIVHSSGAWKCLEAIDLVLLAAQLDPVHTWENVIRIGCDAQNYLPSLTQPAEIVPRLRLLLNGEKALSKSLRWLQAPWLRSPGYHLTRKWLLNQHRSAWRYIEHPFKPVALMLDLCFESIRGELTPSAARRIIKLASTPRAKNVRYDFTEINFHNGGFCDKNPSTLLQLQYAGVRIGHFDVSQVSTCAIAPVLTDSTSPVEVIKFTGVNSNWCDEWWRMLREAVTIKEVIFDPSCFSTEADATHVHCQIAVALLYSRSPTSIEHVNLGATLSKQTLTAMLQVLKSDHPLVQLGWTITPGLYRKSSRGHLRSLRVVLDGSFDEDKSLFFELLRTVGSSLETLSVKIASSFNLLTEADLATIITVCPYLECLSLRNVSLVSLNPLANASESGLCKTLSSLIHDGELADAESLASFFEACSDPRSRLYARLRQVEFSHRNVYGQDVLRRIYRVIERDQMMQHIALDLRDYQGSHNVQSELVRLSRTPVLVPVIWLSSRPEVHDDACCTHSEIWRAMELRKIICEPSQQDLDW